MNFLDFFKDNTKNAKNAKNKTKIYKNLTKIMRKDLR